MQTPLSDTKALDTYYHALHTFGSLGVTHEQGVRGAFRELLAITAKPAGWTLVEEHALPGSRKRPDGTLLDVFQIPRGYWEAKDTKDDLEAEIKKKIALKYDLSNTIFEDTRRAVLYQNRQRVLDIDLTKRDQLSGLLTRFLSHSPAEIEEYHKAADVFAAQIPTLAKALLSIVDNERQSNSAFKIAFHDFQEMCRTALNPDIHAAQIEEMLVQHLLTERLFRNVFGQSEFAGRNVIAAEIEKVIAALTSQSFSREAFLKSLDYFYVTIERAASTITDFSEKQGFLNNVYERFFQNFSPDTADTHGIVYTPQPIVDFMCASVEQVLQSQFGKGLSDKGVTVLDPCTGTGNFLVNILRRVSPLNLRHKYEHELFANEVMLLPYYVASLNMERAFYDRMGQYAAFPGLCFADTLDLAKGQQLSLAFTERNTERVKREQDAAITVIIGNPPYNVGQANENDNNKNRKYPEVDGRIKQTYVKDSKASNKNALWDAYIRFFRWASDRVGNEGIVCFVTNNGFLNGVAFDGFRKHLAQDFTHIYHFDFRGNARTSGQRRRDEGGNIFNDQIRTGIGVTLLVRSPKEEGRGIHYHVVGNGWKARDKTAYLRSFGSVKDVAWQPLIPDKRHNWLTEGLLTDYDTFLPLGTKEDKTSKTIDVHAIFKNYGRGVATCRDEWAYDFQSASLQSKMERLITNYNAEMERWKTRTDKSVKLDGFVDSDDHNYKWSEGLKSLLSRGIRIDWHEQSVREAMTRPFCKQFLYYDRQMNERVYQMPHIFPLRAPDKENLAVSVTAIGCTKSFHCLMTDCVPDLHLTGDTQCFPLYTYSLGGLIKRDNITDWALTQFQAQYGPAVTKPDIFYSIYALLHSPAYRERYKENLKRDLPRIPLDLPRVPLVGRQEEAPPSPPSLGGGNDRKWFRFTRPCRAGAQQEKRCRTASPQTWGARGTFRGFLHPRRRGPPTCQTARELRNRRRIPAHAGGQQRRAVFLARVQDEAQQRQDRHCRQRQPDTFGHSPGSL